MGDARRIKLMTDFIKRNYPRVKKVLCVADGKGELGMSLQKVGYDVTVIDPVVKRDCRVPFIRNFFTDDFDAEGFELLIGMHPDEATVPIIRVAKKYNIKFAVVPCCIVGPESEKISNYFNWLARLREIAGHNVRETELPMVGMKRILFN
jgi:hypothetical protein